MSPQPRQRRPYCRTWTLADLDQETVYRLWYDEDENRWEVRPADQDSGTLVTRLPMPRRSREPRRVGAPAPSGGGALDGHGIEDQAAAASQPDDNRSV